MLGPKDTGYIIEREELTGRSDDIFMLILELPVRCPVSTMVDTPMRFIHLFF